MSKKHESKSKFLSLVLRHQPEIIGLCLDDAGWAVIDELLVKAAAHGTSLTRSELDHIVANNDKKRFSISDDGRRIRANQGHSISIDLGLAPVEPPEVLYHGTATRFLDSIRADGLLPGSRQHVHLSLTADVATQVGKRHGKPVVLLVRAREMHRSGHSFYVSENGVWLTASVPASFLEFPPSP